MMHALIYQVLLWYIKKKVTSNNQDRKNDELPAYTKGDVRTTPTKPNIQIDDYSKKIYIHTHSAL